MGSSGRDLFRSPKRQNNTTYFACLSTFLLPPCFFRFLSSHVLVCTNCIFVVIHCTKNVMNPDCVIVFRTMNERGANINADYLISIQAECRKETRFRSSSLVSNLGFECKS